MSYGTKNCPHGVGMNRAENHERITIEVVELLPCGRQHVETVARTVMSDDGKRYVTYAKKRRQLKKMKRLAEGRYELVLLGNETGDG